MTTVTLDIPDEDAAYVREHADMVGALIAFVRRHGRPPRSAATLRYLVQRQRFDRMTDDEKASEQAKVRDESRQWRLAHGLDADPSPVKVRPFGE